MVVGVNAAEGVKVTEQLPEDRSQLVEENVPVAFASKVTVPVGSMAVPVSESVTVAVQVVSPNGRVEAGAHTTETVTDLVVALIAK
jgi:hypothetical protein